MSVEKSSNVEPREKIDQNKVFAATEAVQSFFDHLKTNEGQLNPAEMQTLARKFSPEVLVYIERFLNDFKKAKNL